MTIHSVALGEEATRVVDAFVAVARPPMVRCWGKACCINATRAALWVMRHYGIPAAPFPCKLAVSNEASNVAKIVGFTEQERIDTTARCRPERVLDRHVPGEGWPGHLALVVKRQLLLDPSFDQAAEPEMGLHIPEEVLALPVPKSFVRGTKTLIVGAELDNGAHLKIQYWPSKDWSFRREEAWSGTDALFMAMGIVRMIDARLAGMPLGP